MKLDLNIIPSPCFVLEEELLERNLKLISEVQKKANIKIILAFKGFAMQSCFPQIKQYISGVSASSLNEAKMGFDVFGVKTHLYSPAYLENEFDELVKRSSHITFNSLNQWEKFKDFSKNVSCGLRVNPEHCEVGTDLYNPCSKGSRLGILSKDLPCLPDGIEGIHVHALCENDSYAFERLLNSVENKFSHILPKVKWINFGGGHLMTKKGYDIDHLINTINKFKEKYSAQIILEPGSAFAWETGSLVSTVLDITNNYDIKTAILDVSFTCHMPDCLEMPYKPLVVSCNYNPNGKYIYRLGGISCLAGDFMEDFRFDNELKIGDKIVFNDMIHYTMVKTTTFNGINLPSIGILKKNNSFELVKKFGFNSYCERL